MLVKGKRYKTLWLEKEIVKIIDQTKLPFRFKIIKLQSLNDFCEAISNMQVRGAPLIGVTGAFGMAVSMSKDPSDSNINKSYDRLLSTRPTAVNLRWSLDLIKEKLSRVDILDRPEKAMEYAKIISDSDESACESIGDYGLSLIHI